MNEFFKKIVIDGTNKNGTKMQVAEFVRGKAHHCISSYLRIVLVSFLLELDAVCIIKQHKKMPDFFVLLYDTNCIQFQQKKQRNVH